ncbi:MAG: YmfQ family protein, partial [Spirochaetaceae bacterium]|nr:YmfQ family protein [Spirochaetaceae bacterium]
MAVAPASLYQSMFQKLFPQGDYWDAQFADPQSDLSRLCTVKSVEFTRLKERMTALQNESTIEKTEELISEWERVLLDSISVGLTLEQRRMLLKSKYDVRLNKIELQKVADLYGLTITSVTFPYRPGFFGFSCFGRERMASPAAFS